MFAPACIASALHPLDCAPASLQLGLQARDRRPYMPQLVVHNAVLNSLAELG